MTLLAYLILAVLIIAFAVWLTRQGGTRAHPLTDHEKDCGKAILNDPGLDIAERIFDPGDYRWLHDEIGFPELARELARQRQTMALMWLRCLRASFSELVRLPASNDGLAGAENDAPGLTTTLLTLRFQCLLAYATLVVWLFGPYTRMAPSISWLGPVLSHRARKERYGLRV